jgi:hypothetical protein
MPGSLAATSIDPNSPANETKTMSRIQMNWDKITRGRMPNSVLAKPREPEPPNPSGGDSDRCHARENAASAFLHYQSRLSGQSP